MSESDLPLIFWASVYGKRRTKHAFPRDHGEFSMCGRIPRRSLDFSGLGARCGSCEYVLDKIEAMGVPSKNDGRPQDDEEDLCEEDPCEESC